VKGKVEIVLGNGGNCAVAEVETDDETAEFAAPLAGDMLATDKGAMPLP
jgi:hypothetical protein